jgi:uncharacterized cupin superfamily protein
MEGHPGLFVSDVTTDAWETDPEVGGLMHVLCTGVGVEAGMSRFDDGGDAVAFTPQQRETALVLEGTGRIEIDGGPTVELRQGVMFSIPAGTRTTWYIEPGFKEFWVIAGQA